MNVLTVTSEAGTELIVNGLRFSAEVLSFLAPQSGEWQGPLWIRRFGDVAEITTVDPSKQMHIRVDTTDAIKQLKELERSINSVEDAPKRIKFNEGEIPL